MLDQDTRNAILQLRKHNHGVRAIARALSVSRNAVRKVLRQGGAEVPPLERTEQLTPYLDRILVLHAECDRNLYRVWERLEEQGVEVGYSTLTSFCRRHGIGVTPKKPVGRYEFAPGEEMQHDTSPHAVTIDNARTPLQCATMVSCYSHAIFAQLYPRWSRFECRVFLSESAKYFEGVCGRCMIDNSSVIIARGSGKDAVPAPSLQALADRFGFQFEAHELGDKDRSARVERAHYFVERNFYPGRQFQSLDDLNRQLRQWCDRVNARPRRHLSGAVPAQLLHLERPHLRPLPLHIPEVYEQHGRRVDTEGYINLHTNRYSVPAPLLGRQLDVRESIDSVRIFDGKRLVAQHSRLQPGARKRQTLDEHVTRPARRRVMPPSPQERTLRALGADVDVLVDRLRKRYGGQGLKGVRQLHRMYLDYPTPALLDAVHDAVRFGLDDLRRIERMILDRIAGEYFRLPLTEDDHD